MLNLKNKLSAALVKLYGDDPATLDKRVKEVEDRVEKRRGERRNAGVPEEYPNTPDEYDEWMNLNG